MKSVVLGLAGAVWLGAAAITGGLLGMAIILGDAWCPVPTHDSAYGRQTWSLLPPGPGCAFGDRVEAAGLGWTFAAGGLAIGGAVLVVASVRMWRSDRSPSEVADRGLDLERT